MIYASKEGVYLFEYDSEKDSSSVCDYWFESIEETYESCLDNYGIKESDWVEIPDPYEGCQQD